MQIRTSVEIVRPKLLLELHEVASSKLDLPLQPSLLGVLACALYLELVVVYPDDLHVREPPNLARGPTHAASNVEHTHAWSKLHAGSEIVLVARDGGSETLALVEAAE